MFEQICNLLFDYFAPGVRTWLFMFAEMLSLRGPSESYTVQCRGVEKYVLYCL
jgi:hypothetical protein